MDRARASSLCAGGCNGPAFHAVVGHGLTVVDCHGETHLEDTLLQPRGLNYISSPRSEAPKHHVITVRSACMNVLAFGQILSLASKRLLLVSLVNITT